VARLTVPRKVCTVLGGGVDRSACRDQTPFLGGRQTASKANSMTSSTETGGKQEARALDQICKSKAARGFKTGLSSMKQREDGLSQDNPKTPSFRHVSFFGEGCLAACPPVRWRRESQGSRNTPNFDTPAPHTNHTPWGHVDCTVISVPRCNPSDALP
jgi:hypothetical protein